MTLKGPKTASIVKYRIPWAGESKSGGAITNNGRRRRG
jgi:hypothetical protein